VHATITDALEVVAVQFVTILRDVGNIVLRMHAFTIHD